MASLPSDFFEGKFDNRYKIINKKVFLDGSNESVEIIRKQPTTKPSGDVNEDKSQTEFFIAGGPNFRYYAPNMCFLAKFHCETSTGAACDPLTCTLPPFIFGAAIEKISLIVNGSGTPIEVYNNYFDYSYMLKMLTKYDKNTLDGMTEEILHPYNQSYADHSDGLSPESLARSAKYITNGGSKVYSSGLWPLSHGLSSLEVSALMEIHTLHIQITWADWAKIIYKTTANVDVNKFIIDSIELIFDQNLMNIAQTQLELKDNLSETANVQRLSYDFYEVLPQPYTASSAITYPTITNMQGLIMAFPHTILSNGISKYQFCSNSLSAFQCDYNGLLSPKQPSRLSSTNAHLNVELYDLYKKVCRVDGVTKNFLPAIPFYSGFWQHQNPAQPLPEIEHIYHIYCAPYNAGLLPSLRSPGTVTITTTQSSTGNARLDNAGTCQVIICRIRQQFIQINSDNSVIKYYS